MFRYLFTAIFLCFFFSFICNFLKRKNNNNNNNINININNDNALRLSRVLTSVPIRVGLMYKLADFECGTHSWSICTNRQRTLIISLVSNVGRPDLSADWFILIMFKSGLNSLILSSTPLKAFMPSKSWKESKNELKFSFETELVNRKGCQAWLFLKN